METAELNFRLRRRVERDVALDALQEYLAALWRNGQVVGSGKPIAQTRTGYQVFVNLPAPDALDSRHANRQVRRALHALTGKGIGLGKVRRMGPDPEGTPACRCRRRPFLILYTTCLQGDSPIRCGECFGPVPLYVFPATGYAGDYHDILWWENTYQAIDTLWIGSGAGE